MFYTDFNRVHRILANNRMGVEIAPQPAMNQIQRPMPQLSEVGQKDSKRKPLLMVEIMCPMKKTTPGRRPGVVF
jgi:hypothetical protein